ncbi:MAG: hypothetical protein ABI847_15235, partial [Anaerolineales bacterium]
STNFTTYGARQWGASGDVPLLGDLDGDGKSELVFWRPSIGYWYWRLSSTNFTTYRNWQWGNSTDKIVDDHRR